MSARDDSHGPSCITCGDVAVPMRVAATAGDDGLAECVSKEGSTAVDLSLIEDVAVGDVVLVHACVAIERLDSGAAA